VRNLSIAYSTELSPNYLVEVRILLLTAILINNKRLLGLLFRFGYTILVFAKSLEWYKEQRKEVEEIYRRKKVVR